MRLLLTVRTPALLQARALRRKLRHNHMYFTRPTGSVYYGYLNGLPAANVCAIEARSQIINGKTHNQIVMKLVEKVDRRVPMAAVIWSFPVAFLAHDIEESLGISAFSQKYMASLPLPDAFKTFIESTTASFAASIVLIFAILLVTTFLAWRARKPGLTMSVYALFVASILVNAVTHVLQALFLVSYVPGLAFAIIVALPVSIYILYRLVKENMVQSRHILPLIVAGALMQPLAILFIAIGKLLV